MLSAKKELFTPSAGGYQIARSVRLRSSSTASFTRTPSVAGNQKTFTLSMWVKRGALTGDNTMFCVRAVGVSTPYWYVSFDNSTNIMSLNSNAGGALYTTQVFRDPSAWQHVIYAVDTTQATASNRTKLYINGSQVTTFGTQTYPALNADVGVNSTTQHWIGCGTNGAGSILQHYDGYVSEVNLIDGQALTPTSFGEVDNVTGVWKAKRYTGTYGTNGFYLNFSDNSAATAAAIGKDYSGNGNNWTPNNISVTAGVTYDSMLDVPTLTSATAANFCTLNPLANGGTLSGGNLNATSGTNSVIYSTFALTDKIYWEVTLNGSATQQLGIADFSKTNTTNSAPGDAGRNGYIYLTTGGIYNNGSLVLGSLSTATTNDVICFAYDSANNKLWIRKNNGTWFGSGDPATGSTPSATTSSSFTYSPVLGAGGGSDAVNASANFGQRPFSYTPPTGFVALNTQNLPDATITKGSKYMNAVTYTGTGSNSTSITGVGFQTDFNWTKSRSSASYSHQLSDVVRGFSQYLYSNATSAEGTDSTNHIQSVNSDGYVINSGASFNASTVTYVSWNWNAGGSTVTNTSGSISAQVRANTTAGFSVVTYTGTGANATVGHGLGVTPSMVIVKARSTTGDWCVTMPTLGANNVVFLNLTNAVASFPTVFNGLPTSTIFNIGTAGSTNTNAATFVAYCFAAVAGYSAFGKYTGNGSADGPFTYLGFRPRFIIFKRTDGVGSWFMEDSSRGTYNVMGPELYAESSAAEATSNRLDFLSNGFKMRAANAGDNANGGTYIYMAFAENPFKNSLAR